MGKDKDIKIRKSWPKEFDPSEKIHKSGKEYNRSAWKREIEDELEEMEQDLSE